MPTIALSGASGLVGQFVAARALAAGHALVCLGRPSPWGGDARPWRLGQPAPLAGCDALIHCAFSHVPGRYRGGEGSDPAGFLAANLDGTLGLWDDAGRLPTVFLSSRAVYDGLPPGTALTETLPLAPASLYGRAKLAAEPPRGASLRATGVYGHPAPGQRHKWADLFAAWSRGEPTAPARATEVHGGDLAAAALLLLDAPPGAYNCSDLLLDRRDLLAAWGAAHGVDRPLPPPSDAALNVMDCAKLRRLGWEPGGMERLRQAVGAM